MADCAWINRISRERARAVSSRIAYTEDATRASGAGEPSRQVRQEQRGGDVAGAVHVDGQSRCGDRPGPGVVDGEQVQLFGTTSPATDVVTSTSRGPRSRTASTGCEHLVEGPRSPRRRRKSSSKRFGVTMSARGTTRRAGAPGSRAARTCRDADVAHHRIAAVDRRRVQPPHPSRPRQDDLADRRVSPGTRTAPRRTVPSTPRSSMPVDHVGDRPPGPGPGRATRRTRCGWRSAR